MGTSSLCVHVPQHQHGEALLPVAFVGFIYFIDLVLTVCARVLRCLSERGSGPKTWLCLGFITTTMIGCIERRRAIHITVYVLILIKRKQIK